MWGMCPDEKFHQVKVVDEDDHVRRGASKLLFSTHLSRTPCSLLHFAYNTFLYRTRFFATKLGGGRFDGSQATHFGQKRSSCPPCSTTDQRFSCTLKEATGMQVRTTLIPTCPGSMCSFACQPRLTGLVVQEHQGLATRVCAHPARAMPLARLS